MNIQDVENLAELARIDLKDEEKQEILNDIRGILDYVKAIEAVEVQNAEPELALHNVWRDDSPRLAQAGQARTPEFSSDLIIGQFPDKQDNFLKVKKIL